MICSIANCDGKVVARGWCHKHWQRWKKHGAPDHFVPQSYPERFWLRVQKTDGCWLWTGATAGRYGQCLSAVNVKTPAHRYSWELHNGQVPAGLFVCHRCDDPICVRPDHLFLGDASANMRDMVKKGRHPKQRASYRRKLNESKVRAIRASDEGTGALARRYNVHPSTILHVRKRINWRHI